MKKFWISTLVGGALFLVPAMFIIIVLEKAFVIMTKVARPIEKLLPIDTVLGVGMINVLALLLILLVFVAAGLVARGKAAQAWYKKLDGVLLEIVPGYAWTKTVVGSLGKIEEVDEYFKPVLVSLDDQKQVGFELERSEDNLVVVFLPGAPDVRSGTVAYVTADRVVPIDATFLTINRCMKHMGRGAIQLLPQKPRA
ncbi:MAG: hypothetical protein R3E64_02945 [Halioglobus sp.]